MLISLVRCPTIIDPSASTSPITPPLGLAYLHAAVKPLAEDVVIVDSIGNKPLVRRVPLAQNETILLLGQTSDELALEIPTHTDVTLFSCMFSQDWPYARKVLRAIKHRAPDTVIVGGGEHFTAAPEFSLRSSPELDFIVLGEGEAAICELLKCIVSGTGADRIPNVICRNIKNPVKRSQSQIRNSRVRDLDSIGRPLWDGFPLEKYFEGAHSFGVNLGARTMPILASRGCPYQCTFCSSPYMWSTKWVARSPEEVISEIQSYQDKYGANNFDFYDLTAIVKRSWIVSFCEMLISSELNITWQLPSGTRSEVIDGEIASLLYRSGCRNLSYAPESGSPRVLAKIKKQIDIENMLISMRACVENDLSVKANLMCGFPTEKLNDLWQSYKFAMRPAVAGIDDISVNQFSPYPGSELFNGLLKKGRVSLDERYFEELSYYSSMTRSTSYSEYLSPKTILFFKIFLTSSFYLLNFMLRPSRLITLWNNVKSGTEATRLEKTIIAYRTRKKAA